MKASKGEEKIISLLKQEQYEFEREKRFKDLKHGLFRFDFYVHGARPCILEYNGEQHYQYINKFYNKRSDFEGAKERDRRKISYCLAHNIPIYCIPYWELDKCTSATDLFKEQYRARDRWKNDHDYAEFKAKEKFDKWLGYML